MTSSSIYATVLVLDNETVTDPLQPEATEISDIRFPLYLRWTATTICLILLSFGCPGNLLVPYVVLKTKDLRNSTNIFLINLSISDLLILLVISPTILFELHSQPEVWFFGRFACKAVSFTEICAAHASILTMITIGFERYYAICKPLKARYKCTKRRAVKVSLSNWLLALASTLPMIWITRLQEAKYMDGSMVPVCVNTLQTGWHPMYYILIFVLFFVIPFVILLRLLVMINRQMKSDYEFLPIVNHSMTSRYLVRRQVVLMLASVCITFFVCLLPYRLMTLWIIASTYEQVVSIGMDAYYIILFVCRLLLLLNAAINPLLYNVISCKFRAVLRRIFRVSNDTTTRVNIAVWYHRENAGCVINPDDDDDMSTRRDLENQGSQEQVRVPEVKVLADEKTGSLSSIDEQDNNNELITCHCDIRLSLQSCVKSPDPRVTFHSY